MISGGKGGVSHVPRLVSLFQTLLTSFGLWEYEYLPLACVEDLVYLILLRAFDPSMRVRISNLLQA